jgi:hypothetical protein
MTSELADGAGGHAGSAASQGVPARPDVGGNADDVARGT